MARQSCRHLFLPLWITVLVLLWTSFGALSDTAYAIAPAKPRESRIVIITSQPYATEWFNSFNDAFVDEFSKERSLEPKISYEYIDGKIAYDPQIAATVVAFLKQKYNWNHVDLIIGVMPAGSTFLLEHGEKFAKGIPKLFVLPSPSQAAKIADMAQVGMIRSTGDALSDTVKNIRNLLPETRRLYVVAGAGADDQEYLARTRKILSAGSAFATVTYLEGLDASELVRELSVAPKDSAVLLLTYVSNRYEQPVSTTQVLRTLTPHLHMPVFSFYDTVLGKGIVGGSLTSTEAYGCETAAGAQRLLAGERKAFTLTASPRYMYDWRQLKRWEIGEKALPANSVVKYREYSAWELYRWHIAGALMVLVLQGIFIVMLLLNRARRRKLEKELRVINTGLEDKVEERTKALSTANRELVTANEELKAMNEQMAAMNEALDELNQRMAEELLEQERMERGLAEANRKLKELDLMKSMFIASMSHELRTPLNSIIGFTGMTLQELSGPLNEEQKDNLSRVKRSANHLLALITEVIDISKIESGKITSSIEPFSLNALIREAIDTIQSQAEAKGIPIEFQPESDIAMLTDRRRLLQCMINYLSNAVKYSETGKITVGTRQTEEEVELSVTDTGIGIAPEDLTKLFEPFERVKSHLQIKAGGTGLGLYLTKKLVTEVLHGDVSVDSVKGSGSTFRIRVPKNAAKEAILNEKGTDH